MIRRNVRKIQQTVIQHILQSVGAAQAAPRFPSSCRDSEAARSERGPQRETFSNFRDDRTDVQLSERQLAIPHYYSYNLLYSHARRLFLLARPPAKIVGGKSLIHRYGDGQLIHGPYISNIIRCRRYSSTTHIIAE